MEFIKIEGAREHNLKNVNVKIPKNKLVVITGLSGSGKSSLAFDTIYVEGQRRYMESLSSYVKRFWPCPLLSSKSVSAPSSVTNTSPCCTGLIVPGSTLRYGSNLRTAIRKPADCNALLPEGLRQQNQSFLVRLLLAHVKKNLAPSWPKTNGSAFVFCATFIKQPFCLFWWYLVGICGLVRRNRVIIKKKRQKLNKKNI